jgi:hypothetical protein
MPSVVKKEPDRKPRKSGRPKPPAPAPANTVMLTRGQAAFRLGVSLKTMAHWASERVGPPFVKFSDQRNGIVRYPSDELDAWIESRRKSQKGGGA